MHSRETLTRSGEQSVVETLARRLEWCVEADDLVLGIDLGGSKILTAVVGAQGRMLSSDRSKTPAGEGHEAVIDAILESAHRALEQAGVSVSELLAVGAGAPGLVNPWTGIVATSPHLPGWRDVPLRDIIQAGLGKVTFLINDANAAALGELRFGAARGASNFIYITVSTGIGGGIVIDGEIYSGNMGMAGEVGHMTIDDDGPPCNCGNRGCWETLASGTALRREARRQIAEGAKTAMLEYAEGSVDRVTPRTVQAAAERGDELARQLIARTGYYLGVGLANLVNMFNPELIVIGGGLSNIGEMLLEPAFDEARKRAYPQAFEAVQLVRAELGGNSGVLGAAALALDRMREQGA
ncbi:MAG: ROK family protein [Dehalococcoidia bacterium]